VIKTIWFFTKIAIIAAAGVWLATREGSVELSLMGYDVTIQSGLFFLSLFILFTAFLALYRLVRAVLSTPKAIAKYQEREQQKKSYKALTRGLVAVAAGDSERASEFADKSKDFMPDQNALSLLLSAQAAQLKGDEKLAIKYFKQLSDDEDAGFLGLRGLLIDALKEKKYKIALDYARQAQDAYPGQGWLLKTVYDLEIRNHQWDKAIKTGKLVVKTGGMDEQTAQTNAVAIHLMRGDYERDRGDNKTALKEYEYAHKIDPNFVPTVTRLARFYLDQNKKKKAVDLVRKIWKTNPHPDLAMLWEEMAPPKGEKNNTHVKRLKWFEDLVALNPDAYDGQITAARTAMDIGYWGEARAYLMQAEKIHPSASLYRLMAIAEQNSGDNEDLIHDMMEKASEGLPDKSWYCMQTGLIYQDWSAIAMPHEGFNTIIWGVPGERKLDAQNDNVLAAPTLLIDPVA